MSFKCIIECKEKLFIKILLSIFISFSILFSEEPLQFNEDQKFKIVQFTDLHWDQKSKNCDRTLENLKNVISIEKPDLVVFTGDVVTCQEVRNSWSKIAEPIIDAKIHWTYVNGNHDHEFELKRPEVIQYLQSFPYFLGKNGDKKVSGEGNYTLEIKSSKGNELSSILYFFDSNSYPDNYIYGKYDRIKMDQIQWYYNKSQMYQKEAGKIIPALAFFHIPLPEYSVLMKKDKYSIGEQNESPSPSDINSGLFNVFLESEDVMGIFVGHDHENDFIGSLYGVSLGYGRVSGVDAVGESLSIGARVIQLQESKSKFVTWIRSGNKQYNNYHHPNNELYPNNNTKYLPSSKLDLTKNGVSFNYYEGDFKSVKDLDTTQIIKSEFMDRFNLKPATREDHFGLEFMSWLKVPETQIYKFIILSDDGSVLSIDGEEIVNNDGSHSLKDESRIIGLEKGFHKFELLYFEDYAGDSLELMIHSLTINKQKLPSNMLFIK